MSDVITIAEEANLGLTDNRSDKVYRIFLEQKNGFGFRIRVEYGRRGRMLQSSVPLGGDNNSLYTARGIFDKLLHVKLRKGYLVESRYTRPGWGRDVSQPEVQAGKPVPVQVACPVRKITGGRIVGW